ncbi:MAG: ribonuclease R, partial [Schleiferiaceae bacterium]|nr:ribonuclease R [Schleiferiaceae bacterium]
MSKESNQEMTNTERLQLKTSIVKIFSRNKNKALNHKQVGARLGLKSNEDRDILPDVFQELINEGHIVAEDRGKFRFNPKTLLYQGKVDMTSTGAAYVVVEDLEEDIYIANKHVKNALHGDLVTVQVDTTKSSRRLSGSIVSVDERSKTDFVGVLEITKNYAFLVPDSRRMDVDIFLELDQLGEAKNGQKALVRMTEWSDTASNPKGEILQILGNPGEHEVEIHSILAEFGLPYEFPTEVSLAAEAIPHEIPETEIKKRRDMREVTTFTIDPVDAKDFDDALSFKQLENGHYEIGVHIADVTHYVTPGDIIDQEAYLRATSVYLVDRVVPMLPEVLSNNLCSLRPNEDKLTFSAVFEMDDSAKIHDVWLGRTVTHSNHRFAYEDAQVIIEGAEGPYESEIRKLDELAKILRKQRFH